MQQPRHLSRKIDELFEGFEDIRAYIDDILIFTKSTWKDHLNSLGKVLQRMKEANLKINASKSFFGRTSCEYLGYWVNREGIQPIPKKLKL